MKDEKGWNTMRSENYRNYFKSSFMMGPNCLRLLDFESNKEYNEIMFLREIIHSVNAFNGMADVIRLYSKKPETATQRLANLLSEDSESV